MRHQTKKVFVVVWSLIFLSGVYLLYSGVRLLSKDIEVDLKTNFGMQAAGFVCEQTIDIGLPLLSYASGETETIQEKIADFIQMYGHFHPFSYSVQEQEQVTQDSLDAAKKLIAERMQETYEVVQPEYTAEAIPTEEQPVMAQPIEERAVSGIAYTKEMLDYDFMLNNFYTVDNTTSISSDLLNAGKLLEKDMTMKGDAANPQILIYHTHSQEAFVDSTPGDSSTTIVGVGDYLTKLLHEKYGFNVIHDKTTYDLIDGKIDRNQAYSLANKKISKILEENPTIEVVIDLHRDGIDGNKLVTEIDGKPTAKIMFFNGLSYTNKNGAIAYLENPYIEDNLAFSLQLHIEAAKYYPGFTRKIYLKGYRYNLHLKPKAILVEAGAQNNTLQEELNAMEPLAEILARVLTGEK